MTVFRTFKRTKHWLHKTKVYSRNIGFLAWLINRFKVRGLSNFDNVGLSRFSEYRSRQGRFSLHYQHSGGSQTRKISCGRFHVYVISSLINITEKCVFTKVSIRSGQRTIDFVHHFVLVAIYLLRFRNISAFKNFRLERVFNAIPFYFFSQLREIDWENCGFLLHDRRCDVACFLYDSTDSTSFAQVAQLHEVKEWPSCTMLLVSIS